MVIYTKLDFFSKVGYGGESNWLSMLIKYIKSFYMLLDVNDMLKITHYGS